MTTGDAVEMPGEVAVLSRTESALDRHEAGDTSCRNCGGRMHGTFCSQCGQRAGDLHLSVGHFVREALGDVFSFDSRVWSTLVLLMRRPAFLTVEYWQGRRARYVAPLRLYLLVSFFTFLVQGVLPSEAVDREGDGGSGAQVRVTSSQAAGEAVDWDADFADAGPMLRWMALNIFRPIVDEPERVRAQFAQRLPLAFFALVPFFAAVLRLLYRSREPYFVPHLIFALHFHAAAFVLLTAGWLGDMVTGRTLPGGVANLAILALLYVSLRRAYGDRRTRTVLKEVGLLLVHAIAASLALTATFVLASLST